jgi:transcriptional activator of cad operon
MDCASGESLRIGDWRVDPSLNEISREGRRVRLEARAMNLLLRLAQRPGEVVSVDDLLTDVWSGVVVTADSVYQAIASLRRELGDDAKQPAYIATIPRLGYRMVAPVCPWTDEDIGPAIASPAPDVPGRATAPGSKPLRLAVYGALAVLLVIAITLFLNDRSSRTGSAPGVVVLPFLDLTTQAMDEEYFADGLTEEVIARLSKLAGVRVAAPTSSYALQNEQLTAQEVGRSLGAAYVVDGSLRRSDTQWRVAMRLTRTADGYVVWSETYDRPLVDKLRIQDEIAQRAAISMQEALATR